MLAFMGISGFAGKRNIYGIKIELDIPEEIYANRDTPIKIVIKNNKRFLPSFILRIYSDYFDTFIPYISSDGKSEKHIIVKFKNRGEFSIDEIYLCSVFPFNFFVRCVTLKVSYRFVVFPEPKKCQVFSDERLTVKKKGERFTDRIGFEGDIVSIREYNAGDPLKYIHWKASAKTGKLKTKELGDNLNQPVVIDLNYFEGDLERRLSCGTYLVLNLYKKSIPFGLKLGDKYIKPDISYKHKMKILRELGLYGKY